MWCFCLVVDCMVNVCEFFIVMWLVDGCVFIVGGDYVGLV